MYEEDRLAIERREREISDARRYQEEADAHGDWREADEWHRRAAYHEQQLERERNTGADWNEEYNRR